jgi:hypothetical protein
MMLVSIGFEQLSPLRYRITAIATAAWARRVAL